MTVPILSFGTLFLSQDCKRRVMEALEGGRLSGGKLVRELEEKFSVLLGVREAVAVSSGTDADILALAALQDFGAQRGDEVILPALSFPATGHAVIHAGFRPVFVDIHRRTLNIDPARVEAAITEKTRAILPVHLMGKPAEMDALREVAGRYGLWLIEDAAEAHGAAYKGKPAGTLGDMAAFSLYVAHILTAVEGGIIATDREDLAGILRSLRSHGRACKCRQCVLNSTRDLCPRRFRGSSGEDLRFRFERIGYSAKMNELEAAVGLGSLDLYPEVLNKRRRNLTYVLERFDRFRPYLETIREEPHETIGPHALPIVLQEEASFSREEFVLYLEEQGIETRTLFASMPTQCPGFAYLGYHQGQFPNAEYVGRRGLHVGVHQDLGLQEMDYLLERVAAFLEERQN